MCVSKLFEGKLCVGNLCVSKWCVGALCVEGWREKDKEGRKEGRKKGRKEGRRRTEVHNQKQEPHTMMWGKSSTGKYFVQAL